MGLLQRLVELMRHADDSQAPKGSRIRRMCGQSVVVKVQVWCSEVGLFRCQLKRMGGIVIPRDVQTSYTRVLLRLDNG